MARKKVDEKAAKEAKQKKIAIVGAVLLLALMAFQVPRTMKMINNQGPDPAAAVVQTTPAPGTGEVPLVPPTLAGGELPAAEAGAAAEADTGPAAQLIAFDRFASKDPFSPQVGPGSPGSAGASGGAPAGPADGAPSEGPGLAPVPGTGAPVPPASGESGGSAVRTTAVISVNDEEHPATAGAEFPAAEPLFVLVSVAAKSVKIGIADGSYADGAATITLELGKPLTLVNTADGTRYELRLVSTA